MRNAVLSATTAPGLINGCVNTKSLSNCVNARYFDHFDDKKSLSIYQPTFDSKSMNSPASNSQEKVKDTSKIDDKIMNTFQKIKL